MAVSSSTSCCGWGLPTYLCLAGGLHDPHGIRVPPAITHIDSQPGMPEAGHDDERGWLAGRCRLLPTYLNSSTKSE